MKIERPKSAPPFAAIFVVLVAAVFILSLPFMAKTGRTKSSSPSEPIQEKKEVEPV